MAPLASFGAIALDEAGNAGLTEPSATLFGLKQSPLLSLVVLGVGTLIALDALDDVAPGSSLRLWGGALAVIGLAIAFGPFDAWLGAASPTGIVYGVLGLGSFWAGSLLGDRVGDRTAEYDVDRP